MSFLNTLVVAFEQTVKVNFSHSSASSASRAAKSSSVVEYGPDRLFPSIASCMAARVSALGRNAGRNGNACSETA
nr:MAG TPA: hypothetical protein [Caudoviricetes sp.]